MKTKITILLLLLCSLISFAQQPDTQKKSIKIPVEKSNETDSIAAKFPIKPEENKNNSNTQGLLVTKPLPLIKKEEEFSMFDNSTLRDPGELFAKRWEKKAVEQGLKLEAMPDQFLGDFRSNGKSVNIRCRDHEFPDGDLVRVFVNDEVYIPSLLLTGGYKSFDVPLTIGFNKIVFLALNQGESGPNTAEFQVYDDNGVLVSSKKWNLLTGVKATIIVTKEE
ncbi:hypothetical protein ACFO5O_07690 [Geojedonia litorea]|uniref:Secreted protein n=1 Tax=Geojedonia litorea TaxID=1268269 RepID=A0ABV9N5D1_9FLAO